MFVAILPLVIHVAFLFILILLCVWILVKIVVLIKLVFQKLSGASLGPSAAIVMLALAISLWLFTEAIDLVVAELSSLATTAFSVIPRGLVSAIERLTPICKEAQNYDCINGVLLDASQALSKVGENIVSPIQYDVYRTLQAVYFFVSWVALSYILRQLLLRPADRPDAGTGMQRLFNRFSKLSSATQQDVGLACVLLASAYLSLTSIAVVPILRDDTDSEMTDSAKLKQQLETALIVSDIPVLPKIEDNSASDPLVKLRATLLAIRSSPAARDAELTTEVLPNIDRSLEDIKRLLSEQNERYQVLVDDYKTQQKEKLAHAVSTFENLNKDRKGDRERIDHFLKIDTWFREWVSQARVQIGRCHRSVLDLRNAAREDAGRIGTMLESSAIDQLLYADMWRQFWDADQQAYRTCEPLSNYTPMPDRARLGSNLGVFRFASGWLLETESMPLALVVGMIGFGLLGAVSSAFVRGGVKRKLGQPLVHDLPGVVILGSSAAMVIFLGVFGGLAMFANTTVEPNPYVILFTCFVAAVFSEDAWKWAQGRFQSQLTGNGDVGSQTGQSGQQSRSNKGAAPIGSSGTTTGATSLTEESADTSTEQDSKKGAD